MVLVSSVVIALGECLGVQTNPFQSFPVISTGTLDLPDHEQFLELPDCPEVMLSLSCT